MHLRSQESGEEALIKSLGRKCNCGIEEKVRADCTVMKRREGRQRDGKNGVGDSRGVSNVALLSQLLGPLD